MNIIYHWSDRWRLMSNTLVAKEVNAQLCPTLGDPMDCSLPGSSVHGILEARILEWVTIPFSRGSSQSRDWTQVSYVAGGCFTIWATRERRLILIEIFGEEIIGQFPFPFSESQWTFTVLGTFETFLGSPWAEWEVRSTGSQGSIEHPLCSGESWSFELLLFGITPQKSW